MSELAARPRANSLSQIQADAWSRRDARISEINAQWSARLESSTQPPPAKAVEWPAEWPSRRAPPAAVEPVTNAGGSLPPSTTVETIPNGRAAGLSDYCATVVKKAGADFAGPMYVVDLGAAERLLYRTFLHASALSVPLGRGNTIAIEAPLLPAGWANAWTPREPLRSPVGWPGAALGLVQD